MDALTLVVVTLEVCRNLQVSWSSPASKVLLFGGSGQTRQRGAAFSLSCSTIPPLYEVLQATSSLSRCGARGACRGAYTTRTSVGMTPRHASAIQGEAKSWLCPWVQREGERGHPRRSSCRGPSLRPPAFHLASHPRHPASAEPGELLALHMLLSMVV